MKKIITRCDILVICGILVISAVIYVSFMCSFWSQKAENVSIYVDGNEFATYSVSEITETKLVEIKSEYGKNTLELTSKGARMLEASCPDKIDVQSGLISKPGQMLVCIPNRVTVRILGNNKSNVDKVTY